MTFSTDARISAFRFAVHAEGLLPGTSAGKFRDFVTMLNECMNGWISFS
jgi:hypothetical protein